MNLAELLAGGSGGLLLLLTLIQIAPVKVNPWSAIAKGLGKAINAELYEKMDDLDQEIKESRQDIKDLKDVCDERDATLNRTHILHFNDEILHQKEHTKEHFDQILEDIDNYEEYCRTHENYKNNKAVCAIDNIKRTYTKCMERDSFL